MPKHKQSFVNLRVDPDEQIRIGEATFAFVGHEITRQVYCQAGARGWIYKLREVASGDHYALKVFAHLFRGDGILHVQAALGDVAALPGMDACQRVLVAAETHPVLIIDYPAADRSMLMPWVEGTTWQDIVVLGEEAQEDGVDAPLTLESCQTLALDVAHMLAEIERHGYAHCDVAGANLIIQLKRRMTYLVDVEEMFGNGFPVPAQYPAGQTGYRHRSVPTTPTGQWSPSGDRYAGAVLLGEILCWHDPKIRKVRDQISFFEEDDSKKPEAWRKEEMEKSLEMHYPPKLTKLFRAAWRSDSLEGCPSMADWEAAIKGAVAPGLYPPRLQENPPPEAPDFEPLPPDATTLGAAREPDDFRRIYGIGGREVAVLHALGIATFADLASAQPGDLEAQLQRAGIVVDGGEVGAWIADAAALAQEPLSKG
jgi:predicted flap endonuclease-1-like 5' DNA nuclease